MPGFNGAGPEGRGPRTGRGLGPCGLGLARRRVFGRGRGLRRYFNRIWPQDRKERLESLREDKKVVEEELEEIEKEEKKLQE